MKLRSEKVTQDSLLISALCFVVVATWSKHLHKTLLFLQWVNKIPSLPTTNQHNRTTTDEALDPFCTAMFPTCYSQL